MDLDQNEVKMLFWISLAMLALSGVLVFRFMYKLTKQDQDRELEVKQLKNERQMGELLATNAARDLTFTEIKRELHDNVKTLLTFSNLNMHSLFQSLTKDQQEMLMPSIEGNEKAMEHVDDLSLAINSDWLQGMGLVAALDQEIEKMRKTGLYEIETRISDNQIAMNTDRELLVYRIVQEVLSNIIKHSGAKRILFSIQYEQDQVQLMINDDGKGFNLGSGEGKGERMGMNNMQARAQILQGQFTIDTAPGKGTSISLSVPYNLKHD